MFLDASAIIAILGDEEDAGHFVARIDAATGRVFYSPLSAYEAVIGLARKKTKAAAGEADIAADLIARAEAVVEGFLAEIGAAEMPITSGTRREAVAACRRFGRAVGHPAKLNLGDCFAYASARSAQLPLLFKGNDFPHTDIEAA